MLIIAHIFASRLLVTDRCIYTTLPNHLVLVQWALIIQQLDAHKVVQGDSNFN
jgi:hypothetical protein